MNDKDQARRWTEFMAARPEVASAHQLIEHFNAGILTRICDCGCHSYDLEVSRDAGIKPLPIGMKGRGGCVLSLAFRLAERSGTVEFDVFADVDGYLAGIDVSCNANSEPMPDSPTLIEPPYHVHGILAK
jgi:hypothetical protein